MKFEEMQFSEKMKKAIRDLKYENTTEVQEQAIPALISGDNVICKSFTGSGKTLAFGIGASERLLNGKSFGVLIIGPTRELVVQVKEELHKLNRYTGLKVSVVYGGHGMNYEVQAIRKGVDILVATPGRLLDHIRQGVIKKDMFDMVILDEADRMLDMGFIDDIKTVLEYLRPKNTHLFSATLDGSVSKIIHRYIPTYKEISIKTEVVGVNIVEKNIEMRPQDKFLYLLELVKKAEGKKILVFVSTKRESENVERKLQKSGFYAASIHGDKSQRYREDALKDFKSGKAQILIATDVAARGLQIDNVEFVVNYDVARDKDTHKHRIGRTGRMGAKGIAVTFMTDEDVYKSQRRQGRRPVRSQHSIDNKDVNVWDLANKSRGGFSRGGPRRDGPRRSFGDRERAPRRDFSERPERSFDGPKKSFDDKERPPKKEFSHDDKPRRDFGDKPKFGDRERAPRTFEKRTYQKDGEDKKPNFDSEKKHDFKDHRVASGAFVPKSFRRDREYMNARPEYKSRSFADKDLNAETVSDMKPKRSFGDKPRFSKDGPKKSFDGPRKSFGDKPRRDFGDKPKFGDRDRAPRSFDDKPRKSFGDKDAPRKSFGDKPKFGFKKEGPKKGFSPKEFKGKKKFGNRR